MVKSIAMINTLNESSLHKTLKTLYQIQAENTRTEVPVGPYIADLLTEKGCVIEIQTGSVSSLRKKIQYYFDSKMKVTVVHPVVTKKTIQTMKLDGTVTERKSPKKNSIYTAFRELTGITDLLLDPKLTIDFLECSIVEIRKETESEVQSKNGRRRYPKKWLKAGKKLEEIMGTTSLHGKRSYQKLIPAELKADWTVRELKAILKSKGISVSEEKLRIFLWVLEKTGLVRKEKAGTKNLYSII